MSPDEIKRRNAYPAGFLPLPHPNHPEGGMLFPKSQIDEMKKQEGARPRRASISISICRSTCCRRFPPPIFLTTRPDLGDVSQGQARDASTNFYELFNGILNPKQLEGLRLLLTPFPQQQFNATDDRRSVKPSQGVACFDCHANGHTNGATHLVGDIRPQEFRHRIDTPTLRGVNIQRLFGSQRALKTVEDFTEFEQRAAYFDGDPVIATKKGVNILERGSQVHFMAEFQELLDFPPAPEARRRSASSIRRRRRERELRGQEVFFGKGKCATCHAPPYYTDNTMHDLQTGALLQAADDQRHHMASADGPIKTFPLRGIKDSPPYLHDGRLLTLEDTVEFFNLVLGTKLTNAREAGPGRVPAGSVAPTCSDGSVSGILSGCSKRSPERRRRPRPDWVARSRRARGCIPGNPESSSCATAAMRSRRACCWRIPRSARSISSTTSGATTCPARCSSRRCAGPPIAACASACCSTTTTLPVSIAFLGALASHPNIQVRLFNPFRLRRWRPLEYLTDFARLNRRMHNKSFTVDGQVAIVGGRNIGDEYFDAHQALSFVDLDVMAVGPVVSEVASDFERYWQSESARPAESILGRARAASVREVIAAAEKVLQQPAAVAYVNALQSCAFVQRPARGHGRVSLGGDAPGQRRSGEGSRPAASARHDARTPAGYVEHPDARAAS